MPMAAGPPGAVPTGSMRTKTLRAGLPFGSTTRPPTASCASAFALKFGSEGFVQEPAFGTLVPAPGNFATSSSHAGPFAGVASLSFASLPSFALVRPATPADGLSSPDLESVDLHPASASTAAINPTPARLMDLPSPPG